MAQEIERKFLVDLSRWQPRDAGELFVQGYLSTDKARVVRVRLEGEKGKLTIKGAAKGLTRAEFEYDIPAADARAMLDLCERPLIEKHRHTELHDGMTWEIDVFHGDNEGLVVAELELDDEAQAFTRPEWVRDEVSADPKYLNANLLKHPYSRW